MIREWVRLRRGACVAALTAAFLVPALDATAQNGPRVIVETEWGEIEIEIDTVHSPITGNNFMRHVDAGYYTDGAFTRTVRADNQPNDSVRITVVQATGRSATRPPAIPLERTSVTGLRHRDGTISMARGGPDTATTSFFICIGDQPALDFGGNRNLDGQGFAAFGQVVRGMDVVRRINTAPAGGTTGQTLTPPIRILGARRK